MVDLVGTGLQYCPVCHMRVPVTDPEYFELENGQRGHVICTVLGIADLYAPARAPLSDDPDRGPAS